MLRCFQRTQREQPAAEPELRFPAVRLPESMIEQRQQAVLPWLSYQTIMEDQAAEYDVQQGAGQYAPWVSAALAAAAGAPGRQQPDMASSRWAPSSAGPVGWPR